jgi:hypothetical protein
LAVAVLIAITCRAQPASADDASIADFFGSYAGNAISSSEDGLQKRDLSVRIKDAGDGRFIVDWITFTRKKDGRRKRKNYSITFRSTPREGIFGSAMRVDKFGGAVPLDPIKGDPYVWARLRGRTLSVYALIITDDGGYEMQVYDRTLSDEGLELRFSRIRDGNQLKLIKGTLVRYDD